MADPLHNLLMYIVQNPVMQNESREAQIDATAVQDVAQEIREIADDTREDANRLSPYFATGLRRAASGPLVVEDTDPEGNAIADAFARFLVTTGLATSDSEPVSDSHFRYTFNVDWPRLRELAQRARVDLDAALRAGR